MEHTQTSQAGERTHTMECLRDGNASACPICKPINDNAKRAWNYYESENGKSYGYVIKSGKREIMTVDHAFQARGICEAHNEGE